MPRRCRAAILLAAAGALCAAARAPSFADAASATAAAGLAPPSKPLAAAAAGPAAVARVADASPALTDHLSRAVFEESSAARDPDTYLYRVTPPVRDQNEVGASGRADERAALGGALAMLSGGVPNPSAALSVRLSEGRLAPLAGQDLVAAFGPAGADAMAERSVDHDDREALYTGLWAPGGFVLAGGEGPLDAVVSADAGLALSGDGGDGGSAARDFADEWVDRVEAAAERRARGPAAVAEIDDFVP